MPTSVFRRLHRLRKLEERSAQVALAEARHSEEEAQAEVVEIEDRLRESARLGTESAALLAHHHRFALDGEIQRRAADAQWQEARVGVREAHDHMLERSTAARTVELLAEAAEERAALEAREAEQRSMDEVGAQRWLRRAS